MRDKGLLEAKNVPPNVMSARGTAPVTPCRDIRANRYCRDGVAKRERQLSMRSAESAWIASNQDYCPAPCETIRARIAFDLRETADATKLSKTKRTIGATDGPKSFKAFCDAS